MKKIFQLTLMIVGFSMVTFNSSAQNNTAKDSIKTAVIKVGNLGCNGDMPTIKKQLLNQEGIDEVTFTARTDMSSTFTILYHSSVTDRRKIEKIIETTPGCDDKNSTPYRVKKDKDQNVQTP